MVESITWQLHVGGGDSTYTIVTCTNCSVEYVANKLLVRALKEEYAIGKTIRDIPLEGMLTNSLTNQMYRVAAKGDVVMVPDYSVRNVLYAETAISQENQEHE